MVANNDSMPQDVINLPPPPLSVPQDPNGGVVYPHVERRVWWNPQTKTLTVWFRHLPNHSNSGADAVVEPHVEPGRVFDLARNIQASMGLNLDQRAVLTEWLVSHVAYVTTYGDGHGIVSSRLGSEGMSPDAELLEDVCIGPN